MDWKPLALSGNAGAHLPPLLISSTFGSDSYTLHLTDLISIWSETLSKGSIISRSRDLNTSIDPSSDAQLTILLDKIKLGLAGAKDTTTALTILATDATARPGFLLTVIVNLPGGLAPLEWPIRLSAAPQALLTSQLIMPLLRAQHTQAQEFEALKEVVREKDHVIQKVTDKLEASGTEFGEIFPQVAGKAGRKVDRSKAEEKVRGMAPFDIHKWRNDLDLYGTELSDTAELVGKVFSKDNSKGIRNAGFEGLEEDWWESIIGITINLNSGKFSTNGLSKFKSKLPEKPDLKALDSADDDSFQVQATPPHAVTMSTSDPLVETVPSAEEPARSSQHSGVPENFQGQSTSPRMTSPRAKKISAVVGRRRVPIRSANLFDDDESTADEATPLKEATSPATSPQPVRPRRVLGKLGGKRVSPSPSLPEPAPAPPAANSSLEGPNSRKGRLGKLGGKKNEVAPALEPTSAKGFSDETPVMNNLQTVGGKNKSPTTEADAEEGGRGRSSVKRELLEEELVDTRETSTDRANKKREALKRELEEKAKIPVKKKRKF